jgi:AcrR family transcriptional regulator
MPGYGRFDKKLEHVLRSAAEVFAEHGFDHAPIRAVAERADISVAGLYHYVRSKDELLYLIQFHVFDSLVARYLRDVQTVPEPERRLELLISNHLSRFLKNVSELVVCSREIDRLQGDFRTRVGARQRAYFKLAVDIFADLAKKHGGSSVPPRTSALAVFGAINWIHTWYDPRTGPSADRLTRDFARLFVEGALPRGPARRPATARAAKEPGARLEDIGRFPVVEG